MHNIWGQYTEVEFTDGSRGAYGVARQYYRDFDRLRIESPDKFNRLCHSVLGDARAWFDDDRDILAGIGLAFAHAADPAQHAQLEEEIKAFIKIAVKPTIVSRMFGILTGDTPDYDLQSPFKHHVAGEPDTVPAQYQKDVVFEWAGNNLKDCPGKYLVTQSARRAAISQQPQPAGM